MAKRAGTVPRNVLVDAALPEATETYTVISHGSIINNTMKALHEAGFQVVDEVYKCNLDAQVAQGLFKIQYGDDPDLGMMFAFANSYDKSMRFRCAIGGYVHANDMSVISGNLLTYGRKHTGTADDEVADTIQDQIDNAEAYFKQLLEDKDAMKNIFLTERQYAELLGVLYMELGILTGEQMGIIKREFKKPSFRYSTPADSLWTLYNHILVALDKSHPRTWMEQQKVVHYHLLTEYNLTVFDEDEATDVVSTPETVKAVDHPKPEVNPNQLDLAKQAAAVEELGVQNIAHVEPEQLADITMKSVSVQQEEDDLSSHELEIQSREEAEAAADNIDAVPEPEEITDVTAEMMEEARPKFVLPGYAPEVFTGRNDDPEDEAEDENGHGDVIENESEELPGLGADDLMLISQQDVLGLYPDVEIGSVIELEGFPLEVIDVEGDRFVLKSVDVVEDEVPVEKLAEAMVAPFKSTDPLPLSSLPDSITETKHMAVDEALETYPAHTSEIAEAAGVDLDAEEDADWEKMGMIPIDMSDEAPTFDNTTIDDQEALEKEQLTQEKLDDPVRTVISQEIYDMYGTMQEYEYELVDGQYNVTLKTGEVFVLLQSEIDRRVGV